MALSVDRRQSGAVLIIIVVMTGAMLALFYLLAFRTFVVRDVSRQLRSLVDRACSEAVRKSFIPAEASAIFRQEMEAGAGELRYAELLTAKLVLSTMEDREFDSAADPGDYASDSPHTEFACSFLHGSGAVCEQESNLFQPQYYGAAAGAGNLEYPLGVFLTPVSKNVTIGCEASAELTATGIMRFVYSLEPLRRYITGSGFTTPDAEVVNARVAWWRPLENYPLGAYDPGDIRHGLTLIVSPYGQTDPMQNRFTRLDDPAGIVNDPPGLPGSWQSFEDFLTHEEGTSNVKGGISGFSTFQPMSAPLAMPGSLGQWRATAIAAPTGLTAQGGQRSRELTSCANPATLVRNAFLTTFVGLAMRHGHLRDRTRILLPAPYHRNKGLLASDGIVVFEHPTLNPGVAYDASLPPRPNEPIMVWNFGQDLAAIDSRLPIPYFSFFGGVADGAGVDEQYERWPEMGSPLGVQLTTGVCANQPCQGWTQPFVSPGSPGTNLWRSDPGSAYTAAGANRLGEYHHQIVGQLANCFHVFQEGEVRPDISQINLDGNYAQRNLDFEPVDGGDERHWSLVDHLRNSGADIPWGPNCDPYLNNCPAGEFISPVEFMAGLAMPELCSSARLITDPPFGGATCTKPATPQLDLKGDVISALTYATGSPGTATVKAVRSPGIFPIKLSPSSPLPSVQAPPVTGVEPFEATNYIDMTPAEDDRSAVVLVTHQRFSAATLVGDPIPGGESYVPSDGRWEATLIQSIVAQLRAQNRRIIVVYIPLYPDDTADTVVSTMRDTIQCHAGCSPCPVDATCRWTENKLIVLTPYAFASGANPVPEYAALLTANDHNGLFRRYWTDLLIPTSLRLQAGVDPPSVPLDIVTLSEQTFESILRYEPKL